MFTYNSISTIKFITIDSSIHSILSESSKFRGVNLFSHIAEETRNLAHGFLGALFSVIIVFAGPEQFWNILLLSVGLYFMFFTVCVGLHGSYKLFSDTSDSSKNYKYFALALLCFLLPAFAWCAILAVYGFAWPISLNFSENHRLPILLGILVYGVFVLVMAVSHIYVMTLQVSDDSNNEDGD